MFTVVLKYILVAVEIICSILLIGIILIQRSKSQGAGMAFGAGMGESLFGAQAGNVLTRITVILAIIFLVNTTILAMMRSEVREKSVADEIGTSSTTAPVAPVVPESRSGTAPSAMPVSAPQAMPVSVPAASAPAPQAVPVAIPAAPAPQATP